MKWDLSERTEDALVAYLQSACGGMRVSSAWERDEAEYPAVVVYAKSEQPVSEPAQWHDARILTVEVAVITEGAAELDVQGNVMRTARDRNRDARSDVMSALFLDDLTSQLAVQGVDDIAFSMAQFSSAERSQDGRYLTTTLSGLVVAEPVTGS